MLCSEGACGRLSLLRVLSEKIDSDGVNYLYLTNQGFIFLNIDNKFEMCFQTKI